MTTSTVRRNRNPALLNAMTDTRDLLVSMLKIMLKLVLTFVIILLMIFVGVLINLKINHSGDTDTNSAPAAIVDVADADGANQTL